MNGIERYLINLKEEFLSILNKWNFLNERINQKLFSSPNPMFNHLKALIFNLETDIKNLEFRILRIPPLTDDYWGIEEILEKYFNFDEDDGYTPKAEILSEFSRIYHSLKAITVFISYIKSAIVQRTPSYSTIHQTLSPSPFSLERTLGDESILICADKLAKCYYASLPSDFQRIYKFDGFVTFETSEIEYSSFSERTCIEFPINGTDYSQRFFHISIKDEFRYSIKALSSISHEVSHCITDAVEEAVSLAKENQSFEDVPPNLKIWGIAKEKFLKSLVRKQKMAQTIEPIDKQMKKCPLCPFVNMFDSSLGSLAELNLNILYNEILTDFIAFRLGGIISFDYLLDYFLTEINPEEKFPMNESLFLVLRAINLRHYLSKRIDSGFLDFSDDLLYKVFLERIRNLEKSFSEFFPCLNCQYSISTLAAESVFDKSDNDVLDNVIDPSFEFYNEEFVNKKKEALKKLYAGEIISKKFMKPHRLFEIYYWLKKYKDPQRSFKINFILSVICE